MAMPDSTASLAWLSTQGVDDAQRWLAEQGGAPLAALEASQGGFADAQKDWLSQLARPDMSTLLGVADRLQKIALPQLLAWHQRWLYDLLSFKLAARVRYYPEHRTSLAALAALVTVDSLQRAVRDAANRRAVSEHPLSAKLFIEDMLLDYAKLFQ
jgi:DNA polymerase-3 subunit delta'